MSKKPKGPKPSDTNCSIGKYDYWQGHVELSAGGRRKLYGRNYGEWRRKADEAIRQDALGIITTSSRVGEAFEAWLKTVVKNRNITDSTWIAYEGIWRRHIVPDKLTRYRLDETKALDVQQFFDRSTAKTGIRQRMHLLLKSFFTYCCNEGYLLHNPMRSLDMPKGPQKKSSGRIIVFSDDELSRLLKAAEDHRLRFLFYLALGTGCRAGELSALDHGDLKDGIVRLTKTATLVLAEDGKSSVYGIGPPKSAAGYREVPMSETVQREYLLHKARQQEEYLRAGLGRLDDDSPVFESLSPRHKVYNSEIRKALVKLCEASGVEYRKFHTFRHTFITKLLQRGEPLVVVRELAGHSTIEQTVAYVEVEKEKILHAAGAIEDIF